MYQDEELTTDQLSSITALAAEMERRQQDVEMAEGILKAAKSRFADIAEKALPAAMDEANMETFTTRDGLKITVDSGLRNSVPKNRVEEAHEWLKENGHGALVKTQVIVTFGVNSVEEVARLRNHLEATGYPPEIVQKVEPSSLKSLLTELLEDGQPFPFDLFGAYNYRVAKLKRDGE